MLTKYFVCFLLPKDKIEYLCLLLHMLSLLLSRCWHKHVLSNEVLENAVIICLKFALNKI